MNYIVVGVIVLVVVLVYCKVICEELKQIPSQNSGLKALWKQMDNKGGMLQYLQAIQNRPTWRLSFSTGTLGAVLATIILSFLCPKIFTTSGQIIGCFFLLQILITVMIMSTLSYFNWHILCQGWGCMKYPKHSKHP